ncbi:unnamed protein product [Trichobilharzia szidati]|nr:unnamed protein product [Trichobilharzia szidati]
MKFIHGDSCDCDIKTVFGFDIPNCINMNVTPGSKAKNLVPFAIEAYRDESTKSVIWWSKHGAVAKTVACSEMFKRNISKSVPSGELKMYQCSRLYLQFCKCSVPDTTIKCTLEEPAIAILFSKHPLSCEDTQLPVDFGGSSFANFVDKGRTSEVNLANPPSRCRLSRTIRKKRDVFRGPGTSQPKPTVNDSAENTDFSNFPYQTPRLAPALSNVNKVLKSKKLQRKRKRQMESQ